MAVEIVAAFIAVNSVKAVSLGPPPILADYINLQ